MANPKRLRHLFKAMRVLPKPVRATIIRRCFKIETDLPENLIFKIAESQDELAQAFTILHDSYVESGLMTPEESGMRVTKYHANPNTYVIVGMWDDEVIATLSIVVNGPLGLPLESVWDISFLKNRGSRLAEISGLAVKKNHRMSRGRLLMPLFKYMRDFSADYLGVDTIVAATDAMAKDYYECLLMFKPIGSSDVQDYGFVKNKGHFAQYIDIDTDETRNRLKATYQKFDDSRNLYKFYFETKMRCFQFPEKKRLGCNWHVQSSNELRQFFTKPVLEKMTAVERMKIANCYPDRERKEIFLSGLQEELKFQEVAPRYMATGKLQGFTLGPQDLIISGTLFGVSLGGLRVRFNAPLSRGTTVYCSLQGEFSNKIVIEAKVVWEQNQLNGLQIARVVKGDWTRLVSEIEAPFLCHSTADLKLLANLRD